MQKKHNNASTRASGSAAADVNMFHLIRVHYKRAAGRIKCKILETEVAKYTNLV